MGFMTIDFKVKKEAKILVIQWLLTQSKEVHTVGNQKDKLVLVYMYTCVPFYFPSWL